MHIDSHYSKCVVFTAFAFTAPSANMWANVIFHPVMLSDNLGRAWTGDFESLKQFVSEHLKVDGVWSSPGSDKKLFTSENVIISWRKSKGILLVSGEKAVNIVNELCKQICNGGEG